jgi:hypothetical protein
MMWGQTASHMSRDELIDMAVETCNNLREFVQKIKELREISYTPVAEGNFDLITIQGELDSIGYYLVLARAAKGKTSESMDDLLLLTQRLRRASRIVVRAMQDAQRDIRAHEALLRTLTEMFSNLDEKTAAVMWQIVEAFATRKGAEREAFEQELYEIISEFKSKKE